MFTIFLKVFYEVKSLQVGLFTLEVWHCVEYYFVKLSLTHIVGLIGTQ